MSSTRQKQEPTKERLQVALVLDEFRKKLNAAIVKDIQVNGCEKEYERYESDDHRDSMTEAELLVSINKKANETIREECGLHLGYGKYHKDVYYDTFIKPDLYLDMKELLRKTEDRDLRRKLQIGCARLEGYYEALDIFWPEIVTEARDLAQSLGNPIK